MAKKWSVIFLSCDYGNKINRAGWSCFLLRVNEVVCRDVVPCTSWQLPDHQLCQFSSFIRFCWQGQFDLIDKWLFLSTMWQRNTSEMNFCNSPCIFNSFPSQFWMTLWCSVNNYLYIVFSTYSCCHILQHCLLSFQDAPWVKI